MAKGNAFAQLGKYLLNGHKYGSVFPSYEVVFGWGRHGRFTNGLVFSAWVYCSTMALEKEYDRRLRVLPIRVIATVLPEKTEDQTVRQAIEAKTGIPFDQTFKSCFLRLYFGMRRHAPENEALLKSLESAVANDDKYNMDV